MTSLPGAFFAEQAPVAVADPQLVYLNEKLLENFPDSPAAANEAALNAGNAAAILSGNEVPEAMTPIATAYSGHQYGGWSPLLGDGRAVILGEIVDKDQTSFELQLKGSGRTPFSRGGDGRATMSAVMREYVISEAMAALAIPTSRSLAIVKTGEKVPRKKLEDGAVLTRLSKSHIRVGTFQYAAATNNPANVRALADLTISRLYPQFAQSESPYLDMFEAIVARQAKLIAQWMLVGFIHGVMNTDNMAISGETIDYGPCAYMDRFDPQKTFSSIDAQGRYAWNNQPNIGVWNLNRLAESLLHIIDQNDDAAIARLAEILKGFVPQFEDHLYAGFEQKLGLINSDAANRPFVLEMMAMMRDQNVDFTLFFRRLTQIAEGRNDVDFAGLFTDQAAATGWLKSWEAATGGQADGDQARWQLMRSVNPIFIPRNHQVELALTMGSEKSDFSHFDRLLSVLVRPFDEQPDHADLESPPTSAQEVHQTFCGT